MSDMDFSSVTKMVESISGGDSFASELKKRISDRKIVKLLQAMRLRHDIQQSRIADELKCGQSRISKIESGDDASLSLGEVEAYAKVLNCEVEICFSKRGTTAVDRIKQHAFAIKREMDNLAECARSDESIAVGVAVFFGEAFFNLIRIVEKSIEKLPLRSDNSEPYVKLTSSCDDISIRAVSLSDHNYDTLPSDSEQEVKT